jgi:hypothetical protein
MKHIDPIGRHGRRDNLVQRRTQSVGRKLALVTSQAEARDINLQESHAASLESDERAKQRCDAGD